MGGLRLVTGARRNQTIRVARMIGSQCRGNAEPPPICEL
jgi:hypothetical protein